MKEKLTRGFTLIELLVVIAIIGILASVVLASLNTARDKGADAAAKSSLNNIRAQAELVYDNASPNSYATVCSDTVVSNAISAAGNATGNAPTCLDETGGWATNVQLKGGGFYCVDSSGNSTTTSATTISGTDVTC